MKNLTENELQKRKYAIQVANSEALAAQVIVFRSLGFDPDGAKECMIELMKRRARGDQFDFEGYIEEEVKKIPVVKDIQYKEMFGVLGNLLDPILKK